MMKRISGRGFSTPSPRRERRNGGDNEGTSDSSTTVKTNDCQTPDHANGGDDSLVERESHDTVLPTSPAFNADDATPIRKPAKKGLFKTLRRKLSSFPRRKEHEMGEESCHAVEMSSSPNSNSSNRSSGDATGRDYKQGTRSLPRVMVRDAGRTSNCQIVHSDPESYEREVNGVEARGRRTCSSLFTQSPHANTGASLHSTKQSDISEQPSNLEVARSANNSLLPHDTEYGHASAPVNGQNDDGAIPSSYQGTPIKGAQGQSERSHLENKLKSGLQLGTSEHSYESYESEVDDIDLKPMVVPRLSAVPPFYDQVREPTKEWSLAAELFRLSKYGWYWGPITRVEAEEKLANQLDGAFLVRDSSDERYLLSLSFRSYGRTLHTRIEHCNGVFSFYAQPESEGYTSIVDLIEHSMTDSKTGVFCYSRARAPGAPSFPVRLTKPVSRFTHVRSLQYLCRFVIRQYTRFDHIQNLPLPTSIKGWLEENQY